MYTGNCGVGGMVMINYFSREYKKCLLFVCMDDKYLPSF